MNETMIWSPESRNRLMLVDARVRMGDRAFAGMYWLRHSAYPEAPAGIVHAHRPNEEHRVCWSERQIYPSHWPSKTFVCKVCVLKLMREFRL